MATFIQTDSLSGTTTPSNAGTLIRDAQYGIDTEISGYIIQNIQTAHSRRFDETYDQKNCLVSELDLDETWDVTLTVIGGDGDEEGTVPNITVGDTAFEWNGHKWKVRECSFAGSFDNKKQYTVVLHRSTNFPAQS